MALHIYHVLVTALKEILRSCRSCRSFKLALTNVAVCRGREWLVDANYWHADAWCEDVSSEVRLPQFKATPPPPEFSIVRAWIDDLSRAIITHNKSSCVLIFNRWNLLLLMSHSVAEGNGSSIRIINFILGDEALQCYMLYVICYALYKLHAICYMLYVICYMLYVICDLTSLICYLLSHICYMLYVICYML